MHFIICVIMNVLMDFIVVNLLYNINSYVCKSTLVPVFVLVRESMCMQKVDQVPIQISVSLYTSFTCPSHYRIQSTKQRSCSESQGIFRTLLNLKIYCPCTHFLPRAMRNQSTTSHPVYLRYTVSLFYHIALSSTWSLLFQFSYQNIISIFFAR